MLDIYFEEIDDIIMSYIEGKISIDTIADFDEQFNKQFSKKPEIIAINCGKIENIDSTGINHFFKLSNRAYKDNIKLFYLNIPESVKDMFSLTNFHKINNITTEEIFEADYINKDRVFTLNF